MLTHRYTYSHANIHTHTQADCVDMDCDSHRHGIVIDEDGTLIGGSGGSVVARAELFSANSYFGVPYQSPEDSFGAKWWYPNLPTVMRSVCI